MTLIILLFLVLILALNTILWLLYRHGLTREIRARDEEIAGRCIQLRNAYAYIDELQRRCEILRTARNTEMLAAKTRTGPVVRYYPVQRRDMTWLIEGHLN